MAVVFKPVQYICFVVVCFECAIQSSSCFIDQV